MASVQKGVGVVWSLATGASATGMGTFITQSVDFGISATETEIKGLDGATKSLILSDPREDVTIEVVPSSTTLALAKAANILPDPGADVIVTDTDDAEIAGSGTGNGTGTYIFLAGRKNKTTDGVTRLTFTLRRYQDTHLSTVA